MRFGYITYDFSQLGRKILLTQIARELNTFAHLSLFARPAKTAMLCRLIDEGAWPSS